MDSYMWPVDVISVCNAVGEIRPIRVQLNNADHHKLRIDVEEILNIKNIPYVGAEAHIFVCRAKAEGRTMTIELKYTFRTHTWCLLRKLY